MKRLSLKTQRPDKHNQLYLAMFKLCKFPQLFGLSCLIIYDHALHIVLLVKLWTKSIYLTGSYLLNRFRSKTHVNEEFSHLFLQLCR